MLKQRLLEEEVAELYRKGLIPGLAHPYIGQEAIAAGICTTLQKEDLVVSNHRGHGHSVAKGIPEQTIFSELMGKEAGMCLGIGGSMHSVDLQAGMIFSTAIVGGGIPLANGVALALKKGKKANCVVCFFGDGATNTGAFHEGLNLAALWKLPVVFVCENNKYAISVPLSKSTSAPIVQRGQAYGIRSLLVDGMNVFEVYAAAMKATSGARKGEGPTLMECDTYRYRGHGLYDTSLDYRTQEEINEWIKRDPILQFEKKVTSERLTSTEELEGIRAKVQSRVKEASKFAQNAPYPSVDLLSRFVWA